MVQVKDVCRSWRARAMSRLAAVAALCAAAAGCSSGPAHRVPAGAGCGRRVESAMPGPGGSWVVAYEIGGQQLTD